MLKNSLHSPEASAGQNQSGRTAGLGQRRIHCRIGDADLGFGGTACHSQCETKNCETANKRSKHHQSVSLVFRMDNKLPPMIAADPKNARRVILLESRLLDSSIISLVYSC
jgi:hypothetical protein